MPNINRATGGESPEAEDEYVVFIDEPVGSVSVRGADSAKILRALQLTEAALLEISSACPHYRLTHLYLEAMRELETLLESDQSPSAT